MKRRHADLAALRVTALLLLGFSAACFKLDDDDCALSSSCPGQAIAQYGAARGSVCADCVRKACSKLAAACDRDPVCRSAVKCALRPNQGAVQGCFADVLSEEPEAGAMAAPWDATRDFEECIDDHCSAKCKRDISDWSCIEGAGYDLPAEGSVGAVLYVRFFSNGRYSPASKVRVSYCYGDPEGCTVDGPTNEHGVFVLSNERTKTSDLYFKLDDLEDPARFPPTLFYPRPIERGATQPIAIYLITNDLVRVSNNMLLGTDAGVQVERAQSIVLTDACRPQATLSADGVTIQVPDLPMPICTAHAEIPCVWYGGPDYLPDPGREVSIGTSSGVLGLSSGEYEIQACSDGKLVARRSVWMHQGWLTFARLWPLTNREQRELDAACPQ